MKGIEKYGVEEWGKVWDARADEIIKAVPVSEERAAEIREKYPPMTKEDIDNIIREYKSPSHKEDRI